LNNSVSVKQYVFIGVLYSLGNVFVVIASAEFRRDFWTSILIGAVMAVPLLYIYSKVQSMYPDLCMCDILIAAFGKVIGKIVIGFYAVFFIYLAAITLRSTSDFVVILNIKKTPDIAVMAFTTLICIMIARCGIRVIGKMSLYIFPIIVAITLGTFIFSTQYWDASNILPIIIEQKKGYLEKCFSNAMIPFSELIVLTTVMTRDQGKAKGKRKTNFWPLILSEIISLLFFLAVVFRNFLTIGPQAAALYYYPSYEAASLISVGNFIFRVELFIGIYLMLTTLFRISVLFISCAEALSKLCDCGTQKEMATPVGVIVMTLATVIFNKTEEFAGWVFFYPYFTIPFLIVVPIIIFAAILIKNKKNKNKNQTQLNSTSTQ
jgi:spore germination protein KB